MNALAIPTVELSSDLRTHIDKALACSSGLMGMLDDCGQPRERRPMVHATFDDVGTREKDGMSAVVGYVAYRETWHKFNFRWRVTLAQLNMPYLHTSTYLHGFPLIGGDGMTDDDVHRILLPFTSAIREQLIDDGAFGVSVVTEWDGYEGLTDKEKKFIRPPDIHSFEMAISLAYRNMSNAFDVDNCMAIQMDESHDVPKLYKSYEVFKSKNPVVRNYLGAICFCDDKLHAPIQAADLLGNLLLKAWRSYKLDGSWPKAFRELAIPDGRPNVVQVVYDYSSLKNLAAKRMAETDRMAILE